MHFAAQSHVDNSFGNSFAFTKVNIFGTHVLLEAAYRCGIKRFIHVSTDEVYGENDGEHHNEEMVLEPTNPYSATKAGAEFIAKSYLRSFKLPLIITRGNNVFGPHQYPEKLIPKFICRLQRGLPCCIHGNGENTRSFIFVEDVAKAFDLILHKGTVGEIYNIGINVEQSNLKVAKDILELFDLTEKEKELIVFVEDRKYNDRRYAIDSSKLNRLGWAPETEWKDGLKKTIDWYRTNSENWGRTALETALRAHPNLPTRSEAHQEESGEQ
jgi:dTDP-glucose 4,6-dehydratase